MKTDTTKFSARDLTTVGVYLPFLTLVEINFILVLASIGSIALTQSLVVFALGLPLLLTLQRTGQLSSVH